MPIDPSKYPANWKQITWQIRTLAGNKCELCQAKNHEPNPVTGSKVVLTIHHIDQLEDPQENNSYPNLICLCQRCHLRLDLRKHMDNSRRTRERRNP